MPIKAGLLFGFIGLGTTVLLLKARGSRKRKSGESGTEKYDGVSLENEHRSELNDRRETPADLQRKTEGSPSSSPPTPISPLPGARATHPKSPRGPTKQVANMVITTNGATSEVGKQGHNVPSQSALPASASARPSHDSPPSPLPTTLLPHPAAGGCQTDVNALRRAYGVEASSSKTPDEIVPREVAPWHRKPGSGYLGYLDAAQSDTLEKFRAALSDTRYRYRYQAPHHTDHDLLRFLRAREFNLGESLKMYHGYMDNYRTQNYVSPAPIIRPILRGHFDLSAFDAVDPRPSDQTAKLSGIFASFVESVVFGSDSGGRPVVFQRVQNTMRRKYPQHVPHPDRLSLQVTSQEALRVLCHLASKTHGYLIEESIFVLDMSGVNQIGLVQHLSSPASKQENALNLDYFPETMYKIVIINAPFGVGMLWNVLSPLLPPKTRSKIHIAGGNYKRYLHELLGAENVPSCYGGKAPFEWPAMAPVPQPPLQHTASARVPAVKERGRVDSGHGAPHVSSSGHVMRHGSHVGGSHGQGHVANGHGSSHGAAAGSSSEVALGGSGSGGRAQTEGEISAKAGTAASPRPPMAAPAAASGAEGPAGKDAGIAAAAAAPDMVSGTPSAPPGPADSQGKEPTSEAAAVEAAPAAVAPSPRPSDAQATGSPGVVSAALGAEGTDIGLGAKGLVDVGQAGAAQPPTALVTAIAGGGPVSAAGT